MGGKMKKKYFEKGKPVLFVKLGDKEQGCIPKERITQYKIINAIT